MSDDVSIIRHVKMTCSVWSGIVSQSSLFHDCMCIFLVVVDFYVVVGRSYI